MEEPEELILQKRQAAIKLAKNLEPFDFRLGEEFDAVYVETLTEDIKQLARDMKKLASVVSAWLKDHPNLMEGEKKIELTLDGETEPVTKLMRRYSTRIQKMADLIYNVAYMDFEGLAQEEIADITGDEEDDDDE